LESAKQHCSVVGNSSTESANESSEEKESQRALTTWRTSGAQTWSLLHLALHLKHRPSARLHALTTALVWWVG
jgi:hypothetical protein